MGLRRHQIENLILRGPIFYGGRAARMATREQLSRIFALEAEAMREEIEALDCSRKWWTSVIRLRRRADR